MNYYSKSLKYAYLGVTNPTALKNEVSTCRKVYYDKDTLVMFNQSVNDFYIHFLFKIVAFPQDVVFPLEISETFFSNLIPEII